MTRSLVSWGWDTRRPGSIDKLGQRRKSSRSRIQTCFPGKGQSGFQLQRDQNRSTELHELRAARPGREPNPADVAASFQAAVLDVIVAKTVGAAVDMNKDKIVLAGGVADSNGGLREMLQAECKKHGIALYYPDPILCTDNAAMIGCAAYYKYKAGGISDLDLDAVPDLPL